MKSNKCEDVLKKRLKKNMLKHLSLSLVACWNKNKLKSVKFEIGCKVRFFVSRLIFFSLCYTSMKCIETFKELIR